MCAVAEKPNEDCNMKERTQIKRRKQLLYNGKNPFIGALGIQEPVIPGEPLFKG